MTLPKWITSVTPFSKALAIILFITLPLFTFFLGVTYYKKINYSENSTNINKVNQITLDLTPTPTNNQLNLLKDGLIQEIILPIENGKLDIFYSGQEFKSDSAISYIMYSDFGDSVRHTRQCADSLESATNLIYSLGLQYKNEKAHIYKWLNDSVYEKETEKYYQYTSKNPTEDEIKFGRKLFRVEKCSYINRGTYSRSTIIERDYPVSIHLGTYTFNKLDMELIKDLFSYLWLTGGFNNGNKIIKNASIIETIQSFLMLVEAREEDCVDWDLDCTIYNVQYKFSLDKKTKRIDIFENTI